MLHKLKAIYMKNDKIQIMAKVEVVVVRKTGKRVNTFKKRFLYSCIFVDLIYHI